MPRNNKLKVFGPFNEYHSRITSHVVLTLKHSTQWTALYTLIRYINILNQQKYSMCICYFTVTYITVT